MPSVLDMATNMILGKIGEDLPESSEFTEVLNLNTIQNNFPFFDVLAKRNGEVYVFNIKARKRNGGNGKLNPCYHLYRGSSIISRKFKKALELLKKLGYDTSSIHYCFMVVPIEENTHCCYYWGEFKDLYTEFTEENILTEKLDFLAIKVTDPYLIKYNVYGKHEWDRIKMKYFT